MISGLDWSGDAGDPRKSPNASPLIVTAVIHIDTEHWGRLEEALAAARLRRALPPNYVFHFSGSRPQIRDAFFDELKEVSFRAHARVIDKRMWTPIYLRETTGDERIQSEIVALLFQCPDRVISDQTLLIDGAKNEARKVVRIKTELNRMLSHAGRSGMRKVKSCPDTHQSQGAIVQVADMIAGALHDAGSVSGRYLSRFSSQLVLV